MEPHDAESLEKYGHGTRRGRNEEFAGEAQQQFTLNTKYK
jgi:hypothetical protein